MDIASLIIGVLIGLVAGYLLAVRAVWNIAGRFIAETVHERTE